MQARIAELREVWVERGWPEIYVRIGVASGPCVVTTAFGVVRVEEGRSAITFLEGALDVRCDSGEAEVTSPLGGRRLAAGERMDLALGG